MANRKNVAALVANVPAIVADAETQFREMPRGEQLQRLSTVSGDERLVMLGWLGFGQIASLIGDLGRIGASAYQVINNKLVAKYGRDWVKLETTPARDLCDADKANKKALLTDIETIRAGIKAGNGGNAAQAADAIRKVRDWGSGKHVGKAKKGANANTKNDIETWAMKWDNFPSTYRRISDDDMEDVTPERSEALLKVMDAIAAYCALRNVKAPSKENFSGKSEWPFN